jgi:molecular chaperone GrpE
VSDPDLSGFSPQSSGGPGRAPDSSELEKSLAEAAADLEKLRDDFLRAKAETENIRRRATEDVAKAHRFGIEAFASALLAVKDSLDAALAVENTSAESLKGVELTARQLENVFEKFSIRPIDPAGEKFDPHRHQAISQVDAPGKESNTVVSVLQKGYLLHDRVLRPALVIVSRPPSDA